MNFIILIGLFISFALSEIETITYSIANKSYYQQGPKPHLIMHR
jgi:hypothetical protein